MAALHFSLVAVNIPAGRKSKCVCVCAAEGDGWLAGWSILLIRHLPSPQQELAAPPIFVPPAQFYKLGVGNGRESAEELDCQLSFSYSPLGWLQTLYVDNGDAELMVLLPPPLSDAEITGV